MPFTSHELGLLIRQHGAALALYARQWCCWPEDAVQEALIELARQPSRPRETAAWLFAAVRRRAINQARAERRRCNHQQAAAALRSAWFEPPDEDVGLDLARLQELMVELPELEREIVVARIWGELTFAQIAELTHSSLSAVHRRYQKALSQLDQMFHESIDAIR